jgi:rubredoxin
MDRCEYDDAPTPERPTKVWHTNPDGRRGYLWQWICPDCGVAHITIVSPTMYAGRMPCSPCQWKRQGGTSAPLPPTTKKPRRAPR